MTKAESAASRTPRTEAAAILVDARAKIALREPLMDECVDAEFARTLELEAADLRERLAKALKVLGAIIKDSTMTGAVATTIVTDNQNIVNARALSQKGADHD